MADEDDKIPTKTPPHDEETAHIIDTPGYAVKLAGRMTMIEAQILHDALQREDIVTAIRHDHLASADIPNPGTEVELWVKKEDEERAREVMARADLSDETVVCPHCDAENPASFSQCWDCQGELEAPTASTEEPTD